MKFHFFSSLEGDKIVFQKIFEYLKSMDCEPVTEHPLERTINDVKSETPEESEKYTHKMADWINHSDFIVVDVTVPDVSIGYEMMYAIEKGKPAIILYDDTKGYVPYTLKGMSASEKVHIYSYHSDNLADLKKTLQFAVDDAKSQMDVRFNFFVSPKIVSYLDWIAKKRKMPRAVYLRRLIEKDMDRNKEFEKED